MRSNHFEVMQSYKPVNAAFMENIAFFYSARSNEITKVFQPAVGDLQRHHNKTLLGGLIKAEHVHHSLFSTRGKSKLTLTHFSSTAYSPFLLLHPPQYCHGFGHQRWREGSTWLCWLGCQSMDSFLAWVLLWMGKPGGSFLNFLLLMCFLI